MNAPATSQAEGWRLRLQRLSARARQILPFATGVVATLAALLLYHLLTPGPDLLTLNEVNDSVAQALADATPAPAYSSLVYQVILPSLVYIRVETPDAENEDEADSGLGSGVVVNTDGDMLTSLHVVTNCDADYA